MIGGYYGVDWLGMILIVVSLYLIGEKNKYGFVAGIVGSMVWVVFGFMSASLATIVLNTCLIVLHTMGYFKWEKA